MIKVMEVYESIQGEFPNIGKPCTIVRLAGCNLTCNYCDAPNEEGLPFHTNEVMERIMFFGHNQILITGGEPLLQKEGLLELCRQLYLEDYDVVFETNGTQDIEPFLPFGQFAVDVKLCDEEIGFKLSNLDLMGSEDCLKFVYEGEEQLNKAFEFIDNFLPEYPFRDYKVVFSPINPKECFMESILNFSKKRKDLDIRLQAQIHKVLNVG